MIAANMHRNAGFSMIEVLVTLVILLVGLLGLAGILTYGQQAELESYQRAQALILLQDMVDRINTNRKVATCYNISANPVTDFLGTSASVTPACTTGTANQNTQAVADMTAWSNALLGAAETRGGAQVGAMIGARGCIQETDVTNSVYLVSVAWQGVGATFAPTATCAQNAYGNDAQRRVVTATLRIANLN